VTTAAVILAWYALASLATFTVFGVDKHRATRGQWRVPESTLHTLGLLGGWPGTAAGMRFFRHKTRKPRFTLVVAATAMLHLMAWVAWWLYAA